MHGRIPPSLDNCPVRLVSVHRHEHAAPTRCNARIDAMLCIQCLQITSQPLHPLGRRAILDIAAVGQHVQPDAFDPVLDGTLDEQHELVVSAVHAPV